jgi:hypothetical protein
MNHTDDRFEGVRHERMSSRRGLLDDHSCDELLADIAQDVGATVEAALHIGIDRGQDLALRGLQMLAARESMSPEARRTIGRAALGLRRARLSVVPRASGRIASRGSHLVMSTGLRALRMTRDRLEAMR